MSVLFESSTIQSGISGEEIQRILSLIGVLVPLYIASRNLSVPTRTKYKDDQLNLLLVPLRRLFIRYELDEINYHEFRSELKDLYLSAFQYAPDKLDKMMHSIISSSKYIPESDICDLKKESEYLYENSRKKRIDLNTHSKRLKNLWDKISLAMAFIYIAIAPALICFIMLGRVPLKALLFIYPTYCFLLLLMSGRSSEQ